MQPIQRVAALALGLVVLYFIAMRRTTDTDGKAPISQTPSGAGGEADKPVYRKRLVAIGDLHGDVEHARKILAHARIIDEEANWAGGDDILVQTGDIVDRGTYAWDIYRMMQTLRGQASGQGGQVVSVLGNHEVMNAIGDWRYVTSDDIKHTGGYEQRIHDMSIDGWLGQEWLANYSTTALVPIHPSPKTPSYSFTHGSLRPSFAHLTPYPSKINELGHQLLTRALTPPLARPHPPNPYPGLPDGSTPAEAALYDSGGPYWWRGLAEGKDAVVCKWARQLQGKTGARRIIGGHTPNFEKIVDRCNASIIIIDTGMSRAYGGVLSALEIVYELYPTAPAAGGHDDHRQEPFAASSFNTTAQSEGKRYREKEVVTAIYEKKRKILAQVEQVIVL